MAIVCFSGKKGAGKDTAAEILVKNHDFKRIALADPLRELCSKVFGIEFNTFLDPDKKDKELPERIVLDFHHIDKLREIIEEEWGFEITMEAREAMEEHHGTIFRTPRDVLVTVGTELIRDHVRPDIWIILAFSAITKHGGSVVITDVRFQNERDAFSKAGAVLCLVKRPGFDEGGRTEEMGSDDQYEVIFHNAAEKHVFQGEVNMWFTMRKSDIMN